MLTIGTKAPDFSLSDQNGVTHTLSQYRGQTVVLYFYPRDNTAGCTKHACAFGELYPLFREKGAVVLGVSKDSVASHKKFAEKYGLPFPLLSDTELSAIQAYDVWKEEELRQDVHGHRADHISHRRRRRDCPCGGEGEARRESAGHAGGATVRDFDVLQADA